MVGKINSLVLVTPRANGRYCGRDVGCGEDVIYLVLHYSIIVEGHGNLVGELCEGEGRLLDEFDRRAIGGGVKIAEEDLNLRGPGDFFGSRQSGLPTFKVANLSYDLTTLKDAQKASADWIDRYGASDTPEAAALRDRIGDLFQRAEGTMN